MKWTKYFMKWTKYLLFAVVVGLIAVPAWSQPTPAPAVKAAPAAPATAPAVVAPAKVAPKAVAKAAVAVPAKAAPVVKAPITIEGKVEIKEPAPAPEAAPAGQAPAPAAAPVVQAAAVASGETQSWWQHLLITIISTVGAVAVPVLSLLLVILLKRWNIKIEQDKVQAIAGAAKSYADQMARNALKDGKPLEANAVAKIALDKGRELATGQLAGWAIAQLTTYIEAQCGIDNQNKPVTPATPA